MDVKIYRALMVCMVISFMLIGELSIKSKYFNLHFTGLLGKYSTDTHKP